MNTPIDEHVLLNECLQGNRSSWAQLVNQYSRYVYFLIHATAKKHGANLQDDEAADLHNDFFVAIMEDDFRRLRAFKGHNGCSLRSWLRVIVIRRTIDSLRKRKKVFSLTSSEDSPQIELVDDDNDPLHHLLEKEQSTRRAQLERLTHQLSSTDRLLLEMIYVKKLKAEEIAAALRIKKGAVYTRKTRLIQRLKNHAQAEGLLA